MMTRRQAGWERQPHFADRAGEILSRPLKGSLLVNMKNLRLGAFALLPLAIAVSSGAQKSAAHDSASMALVKPETVGFSSERLENLHALIQGEIDRKELAGAVTILARHGKVVDYRTYGLKDMAAEAAISKNTLFPGHFLTKTGH